MKKMLFAALVAVVAGGAQVANAQAPTTQYQDNMFYVYDFKASLKTVGVKISSNTSSDCYRIKATTTVKGLYIYCHCVNLATGGGLYTTTNASKYKILDFPLFGYIGGQPWEVGTSLMDAGVDFGIPTLENTLTGSVPEPDADFNPAQFAVFNLFGGKTYDKATQAQGVYGIYFTEYSKYSSAIDLTETDNEVVVNELLTVGRPYQLLAAGFGTHKKGVVQSLSGNLAGYTAGMGCSGGCDGFAAAAPAFDICEMWQQIGPDDAVSGTWSIKLNSSLTKVANTQSEIAAVEKAFPPKNVKWAYRTTADADTPYAFAGSKGSDLIKNQVQ